MAAIAARAERVEELGDCSVDGCDEPAAHGRGNYAGKCKYHQRQLSKLVSGHFSARSEDHDAKDLDVRPLKDIAKDVGTAADRLDRALRMRRAAHRDIEAASAELLSSMRELRDTAQAAIRTAPE